MNVWLAAARTSIAVMILLGAACSSDEDGDRAAGPTTADTTTTTDEARPAPERVPQMSSPEAEGNGIQAIATDYDLASLDYERVEFFFEGDAVGYEAVGAFGADGEWSTEETAPASYRSRMVVVRPTDPEAFSGTVFVEWFNVTGGVDAGATWINGHNQMLRSGAVWIGVTSQAVGVNGGGTAVQGSEVSIPQGGLVASDPARYSTLSHPGDLYSYDIFTQAGTAALGEGTGPAPLEGLEAERLIAVGESQSAGRLTTYINAVQPVARVFDGFLVYSRGSGAAPLGDRVPEEPDASVPEVVRIRADLDVPVFEYETEYDVDLLRFADARQDDTDLIRVWEVAGQSHQDNYAAGGYALTDLGDGDAESGILDPARAGGGLLNCDQPINAGGMYASLQAALAHLETWVSDGTAPPRFDRLDTTGSGEGIEVARDDNGIATGGVRTPIVEVPLATNAGVNTNTPGFCSVFGTSRPFDAATLAQLYPGGGSDFTAAFEDAVDDAVEDGIWLEPEAERFQAAAQLIEFG
jgi:hypothetical protein